MVTSYHFLCRGGSELGLIVKEEDRVSTKLTSKYRLFKPVYELFLNHHTKLFDYQDEDMIDELIKMRMSNYPKEVLNKLDQFYMPDNSK